MDDFEPAETFTTSGQGPSINYLVYVLASSLSKGASAYYGKRFGLSLPEMRILSTIHSNGPLSARALVEKTAMDKAMVSRVLGRMRDKDLVAVIEDGTAVRLLDWQLTDGGKALVARIQPVWKEREAIIQKGLSPRAYQQLSKSLKELIRASEDLRVAESRDQGRPGAGD